VILSLDASTQRGSVALIRDRQVVQELFPETPRGRGGALFSCLAKILREGPEIRRVVVGIGPGSYNGIRSAIAAAWGIAMARDIPLVGISSILGLDDASYVAVGDARRGQYFFARINHGAFLSGPELLTKDQLATAVQQSPGLPVFASAPVEFLPGIVIRTPSAARLGMLAAHWAPNHPQPLYLKAAHITTSRRANDRP
jgi:tRNA threonylcarbamoyladenosine biosynthesis protein TsaB